MNGYEDFLRKKVVQAPLSGLEVPREDLHAKLFEFQKDAVGWALRGGRRALFESFGLGKTMQQLEITIFWASAVNSCFTPNGIPGRHGRFGGQDTVLQCQIRRCASGFSVRSSMMRRRPTTL